VIFSLILLSASNNSFAIFDGLYRSLTCEVLLRSVDAKLADTSQSFTVTIQAQSKDGNFKGSIFTLKREKEYLPWMSNAESHRAAVQGDPRWFINTFGEVPAMIFGFKQVDDFTLEIPNAVELSGAIEAINSTLKTYHRKEFIPVKFYPSFQERVPVQDYLEKWAIEGALPLAEKHASMIHDISYHAPAILLPPKLVEHSRRQTRCLLDFISFIEAHKSNYHFERLEEDLFNLKMQRLAEIDEGSGNTILYLNILNNPTFIKFNRKNELLNQMGKIANYGSSPFEMLENYINHLGNPVYSELLKEFKSQNKHTIELTKPMSKEEVVKVCSRVSDQISAIKAAAKRIKIENEKVQ
jgi:hypothetical protein